MRYLWMPRLVERIQAASGSSSAISTAENSTFAMATGSTYYNSNNYNEISVPNQIMMMPQANSMMVQSTTKNSSCFTPENSSTSASSDSFGRSQVSPVSDMTDCYNYPPVNPDPNQDYYFQDQLGYTDTLISPMDYYNPNSGFQCMEANTSNPWMDGGDLSDNLWSVEDMYLLNQQFNNNNI